MALNIRKIGGYYYLVDRSQVGKKDDTKPLYSYGKEAPVFYHPKLFNDLCENKLKELKKGSVDLG